MSEEERNIIPPEVPVAPDAPQPPVEPTTEAPDAPSFELPPAEGPQETPPEIPSPLPTPTGPATGDVTSDDRLMAALAWVTLAVLQLPIVSVVLLLAEGNKDRPFQRYHAVTSITFWVVAIGYEILAGIAYVILGTVTLGCGFACLWVIFFLPHVVALYYALQAYNGKAVEIPVISEFVHKQGWA